MKPRIGAKCAVKTRNPVAKAVKRLRAKVIPDKKKQEGRLACRRAAFNFSVAA